MISTVHHELFELEARVRFHGDDDLGILIHLVAAGEGLLSCGHGERTVSRLIEVHGELLCRRILLLERGLDVRHTGVHVLELAAGDFIGAVYARYVELRELVAVVSLHLDGEFCATLKHLPCRDGRPVGFHRQGTVGHRQDVDGVLELLARLQIDVHIHHLVHHGGIAPSGCVAIECDLVHVGTRRSRHSDPTASRRGLHLASEGHIGTYRRLATGRNREHHVVHVLLKVGYNCSLLLHVVLGVRILAAVERPPFEGVARPCFCHHRLGIIALLDHLRGHFLAVHLEEARSRWR